MTQLTPRHSTPVDALIAQGFSSQSLAGLRGMTGLGTTQTAGIVLSAGSIGATAATGAIATSLAIAVPIVGAAIAGITLAIGAWINRKGPGQKILTTKIVDEAEPILVQNLQAYQSGPHTLSSQQVALANFDNVWSQVEQACGNPQYGNPGQACINDRKRGSTKGYDWFALYRDPIANDPNVKPDPITDAFGNLTNAAGQPVDASGNVVASSPSLVPLFLIAGVALLAVSL